MSVEEKKRSNGVAHVSSKNNQEVEHQDFDLKNYISEYRGHTKIKRLVFIGNKCPSVRLAAFRTAISELKKGRDVQGYTNIVSTARELLQEGLGDEWGYDSSWVETMRRENNERDHTLAAEISKHDDDYVPAQAKRREYIKFLQDCSNFRDAQIRVRECADFAHHQNSVEDQLFCRLAEIENLIYKEGSEFRPTMIKLPEIWGPKLKTQFGTKAAVQAKIKAASGIHHLVKGQFENAAHVFKLISFEIDCPEIISKRDVAIYGTLCAMASFRRAQLQSSLLKSGEFKKFMSLVPGLVEMVQNFVQCKFKKAFEHLESMKVDVLLDYYMSKHQKDLYQKIHELAVVQYFVPFSHAKISRMAEAFGVSQNEMENRLVSLIERGAVQARIDNVKKVVIARDTDLRVETYEKALDIGNEYVRDLRRLLLRMSLQANDFAVMISQKNSGGDSKGPVRAGDMNPL
mmetsp:Transcript_46860/g.75327  ORF Transcript_46860/g.75327 Transcript_46860/m.75327 type:complete len:459 (+) Transcript_46860:406-1782(+)